MTSIYTDRTYLDANPTWHDEDSPFKAGYIDRMIKKNKIQPRTVAEIGCGAGGILSALRDRMPGDVQFKGYEISPQAFSLAKKKGGDRLAFFQEDMLQNAETFDLLLIIDVLEHIPNYYNFATQCRKKAKYKIYHIPLEINAQAVVRKSFAFPLDSGRNNVGHLHFFTAEYALMALKETGHRIIDTAFTDGAIGLAKLHPSLKRSIANVPRRLTAAFSRGLAARLLGGYSLLVLCE